MLTCTPSVSAIPPRLFPMASNSDLPAIIGNVNLLRYPVDVLESEITPLVGVGLLWGNNLSVDFRHGGEVRITELEHG